MKSVSECTFIFKVALKVAGVVLVAAFLSSCCRVFHPDGRHYGSPSDFSLDYRDVFLESTDGCVLHAWFVPALGHAKGAVYFLHGNAQNIGAHISNVHWLPEKGYQVFALDYRGYGKSTGSPNVQGAIDDIRAGLHWLIENPQTKEKPIFLLGQSLGAGLAICAAVADSEMRKNLSGVVLDSPFSNFRKIAREKLRGSCLTWPLQYPLSFLMPGGCNPEESIPNLSPLPVLIMHSDQDRVVPSFHGKRLFRLAREPKFFVKTRNRHISTFTHEDYRLDLLDFMRTVSEK